jgi:hypothetical protein
MRYRTFRNIGIVVALGAFAGCGYACYACEQQADTEDNERAHLAAERQRIEDEAAARQAAETAAKAKAVTTSTPATTTQDPKLTVERFLLDTLGRTATGDKLNDAVPGPIKVNVYAEHGVWSRAKVDFDRDDKDDEKWSFKPGGVLQREVAPAHDEHFTEVYVRSGDAWIAKKPKAP